MASGHYLAARTFERESNEWLQVQLAKPVEDREHPKVYGRNQFKGTEGPRSKEKIWPHKRGDNTRLKKKHVDLFHNLSSLIIYLCFFF